MVAASWVVEDVGSCYWYLRSYSSFKRADVYIWKGCPTNDRSMAIRQGLDYKYWSFGFDYLVQI